MAKYNIRNNLSNFPVKNTLKIVPIKAITNIVIKIVFPDPLYRVIRQTGAYDPAIK